MLDEPPMRVALSNYYTYLSVSELLKFAQRAAASPDPREYFSRRGVVPGTPSATPVPAPTAAGPKTTATPAIAQPSSIRPGQARRGSAARKL
jgi:hypothetical protein